MVFPNIPALGTQISSRERRLHVTFEAAQGAKWPGVRHRSRVATGHGVGQVPDADIHSVWPSSLVSMYFVRCSEACSHCW